jgi:putative heme transporter
MAILTDPPGAGGSAGGYGPVRLAVRVWTLIGTVLLAIALVRVLDTLSLVVVPLVLALFPAAILAPAVGLLRRHGVNRTSAALLISIAVVALTVGVVAALEPQVAGQIGPLGSSLRAGLAEVDRFLTNGPFGLPPIELGGMIDEGVASLTADRPALIQLLGAAAAVGERIVATVVGLFALFFYLRDGDRIARAVVSVLPRTWRDEVELVGSAAWLTISGYLRGQLMIATFEAAFIAVVLLVLGVPLVVPLAVLTFVGGFFPLVGVLVAGGTAVLVALASGGLSTALWLLAAIVVVNQVEAHLLSPAVHSRVVDLHPLVVLVAITIGGLLLGVLGAFLAVPTAATVARIVDHLRSNGPDAAAVSHPPDRSTSGPARQLGGPQGPAGGAPETPRHPT